MEIETLKCKFCGRIGQWTINEVGDYYICHCGAEVEADKFNEHLLKDAKYQRDIGYSSGLPLWLSE